MTSTLWRSFYQITEQIKIGLPRNNSGRFGLHSYPFWLKDASEIHLKQKSQKNEVHFCQTYKKRKFKQVYTSNTSNFKEENIPERKASFFFRMGNITEASILLRWNSSRLKTQKVKYQPQDGNYSMKYILIMAYTRISKSQHDIYFELDHFFFL